MAVLGQANYATPYTFITIAGKAGVAGGADGTGSAARFYDPIGTAVDSAGNVYVADAVGNTIRKVTPGGVVTTLAGSALNYGYADGTNIAARFNTPLGIAVDSAGNLYVADYSNCTIRKVTPAGTNWVVTTLAGVGGVDANGYPLHYGSADGTNSAARFNSPWGVAVDSAGSVYVADQGNCTIRKVTPVGTNWVVTTLAGLGGDDKTGSNPLHSGSVDGTNSAARFSWPCGVAVDSAGNLYVLDQGNSLIRKVTPVGTNWVVTTLAGSLTPGSADGTNSAARFNTPLGIAVDSAGNLYVADSVNSTIRKVTPVGTNWVVTTLAGVGGADGDGNPLHPGTADGTGSVARFFQPRGLALDSAGNLYVGDRSNYTIRKGFPASSVPPPILQPPNLIAGKFGFGITGLPGLAVYIESSANMSFWLPLGSTIYTLEGGTNYVVSPVPPQGTRFFRAHVN